MPPYLLYKLKNLQGSLSTNITSATWFIYLLYLVCYEMSQKYTPITDVFFEINKPTLKQYWVSDIFTLRQYWVSDILHRILWWVKEKKYQKTIWYIDFLIFLQFWSIAFSYFFHHRQLSPNSVCDSLHECNSIQLNNLGPMVIYLFMCFKLYS